jgi:hypothetical protein
LTDEANNQYEAPIVGFVGKPTENKLKFTSLFGESPRTQMARLGPHYYFTDFKNAVQQSDKYDCDGGVKSAKKRGIVRFALFMGETKYIENAIEDQNDSSAIKQEMLKDSSLDKMKEMLCLRISDHDGMWAKQYDSAYLAELELDNGSFLDDVPMMVIKEYNQQVPLSYHFLNNYKLKDNIYAIIM